MIPSFLSHQHWNSHDNQIRSSQHVNPSYIYWDLLYLKWLEFYLKLLNITVRHINCFDAIVSKEWPRGVQSRMMFSPPFPCRKLDCFSWILILTRKFVSRIRVSQPCIVVPSFFDDVTITLSAKKSLKFGWVVGNTMEY